MRLQVAFDFLDFSETLRITEEIVERVDVIEVGTLLLWREGIETLRELKRRFPDMSLLVDSKIADAGGDAAAFFFDAGADAVTVLGSATATTVEATVAEGRTRNRRVVGDTIGWVDAVETARFLKQCGVDEICVNASTDRPPDPESYAELSSVREAVPDISLSVSGRINTDVIPTIVRYQPETLIVGRAVTQSVSPRKAVEELRAAIDAAGGA
jgi:3-hexulose-6-phosphate synthase